MEIRNEIVEVVEREVKREFKLEDYSTTEFSLRTSNVTVKLKGYDAEVTVKVDIDKALGYYYDELINLGKVNREEVDLDNFIQLSKEGVEVKDMASIVQTMLEED